MTKRKREEEKEENFKNFEILMKQIDPDFWNILKHKDLTKVDIGEILLDDTFEVTNL